MSYIVLITKAKEENPNWAPKKLLSELNLGYVEITVKGMPPLYFNNSIWDFQHHSFFYIQRFHLLKNIKYNLMSLKA